MKAQKPAEGILKISEWGDSIAYKVTCDCGQPDHSHDVWVEADETGVSVTVYVTAKSKWWSMNRWKKIWTLVTKGYIEEETTICMSTQQTLNYAETLKTAIKDVEKFRDDRIQKRAEKTQS